MASKTLQELEKYVFMNPRDRDTRGIYADLLEDENHPYAQIERFFYDHNKYPFKISPYNYGFFIEKTNNAGFYSCYHKENTLPNMVFGNLSTLHVWHRQCYSMEELMHHFLKAFALVLNEIEVFKQKKELPDVKEKKLNLCSQGRRGYTNSYGSNIELRKIEFDDIPSINGEKLLINFKYGDYFIPVIDCDYNDVGDVGDFIENNIGYGYAVFKSSQRGHWIILDNPTFSFDIAFQPFTIIPWPKVDPKYLKCLSYRKEFYIRGHLRDNFIPVCTKNTCVCPITKEFVGLLTEYFNSPILKSVPAVNF